MASLRRLPAAEEDGTLPASGEPFKEIILISRWRVCGGRYKISGRNKSAFRKC